MIERITPEIISDPAEAAFAQQSWQLASPDQRALTSLLDREQDQNHHKLMQSHAASCVVCADRDGLLEETEQAWIFGGHQDVEAAALLDVPVWKWRLHVMARGLHHTRNGYRNMARADMLHNAGTLNDAGVREGGLSHSERLKLMQDLDRADGIGNPAIIKQIIEYKQQTLNITQGQDGVQRLAGENPYRNMSDAKLKEIAALLDEDGDDDDD